MYQNKIQNSNWSFGLPSTDPETDSDVVSNENKSSGSTQTGAISQALSKISISGASAMEKPKRVEYTPDRQALYWTMRLKPDNNAMVKGIECNTTTLMYMLQSFGLLPAGIKRHEFEDLYTPLTSGSTLSTTDNSGNGITKGNYTSKNVAYGAKKITYEDGMDVFTYRYKQFYDQKNPNTDEGREAIRRLGSYTGDYKTAAIEAVKGGKKIPHVIQSAADLDYYMNAFVAMKYKLEPSTTTLVNSVNYDLGSGLLNNVALKSNLKTGNVYAGVYLTEDVSFSGFFRSSVSPRNSALATGHKVLIYGYHSKLTFTLKDDTTESIEVYRATDSLWGNVLVMEHKAPPLSKIKSVKDTVGTVNMKTSTDIYKYATDYAYTTIHVFSEGAYAPKIG